MSTKILGSVLCRQNIKKELTVVIPGWYHYSNYLHDRDHSNEKYIKPR